MYDTVIIGSGPTGACIANALHHQGASVIIVDKARGPGGRCSQRRALVDGEEVRWYHGAMRVDIDHEAFHKELHPHDSIRNLLHGVPHAWQWIVSAITVQDSFVEIQSAAGQRIQAGSCVIAIPAPQTLNIEGIRDLATQEQMNDVSSLSYAPMYAILALVDVVPVELWDEVAECREHEPTPSGRIPITLITTVTWALQHLEHDREALEQYWRTRLHRCGIIVHHCTVHRWRYAVPKVRRAMPLFKLGERIVITGDAWTGKPWDELSLRPF
jgi:predicted NAD/FAD-dependent oxidoreductase